MWRIYFARDGICLFLNCPRIGHIHFWFFSRFQIDHVPSSRKAPFPYVLKSWNTLFFPLILKIEKMEHFKIFEHEKWGISRRTHVIDLNREKNRKCIWSISGRFKNKFKCYHIQNISSTYFCRISSNPPLLLNCRALIWPDFV